MNFKIIMLNEQSYAKKSTYYMILVIKNCEKGKQSIANRKRISDW